MFWLILLLVLFLWFTGFAAHVGGNAIHILVLVALFMVIYWLVTGRK